MRRPAILIVGSGGREHALAWRLSQDADRAPLWCAPGNPGMAALPGATCVPIMPSDQAALIRLVREQKIAMVVIGPEAPLAAGLSDTLRLACPQTAVFGCAAAAAQIEASKAFAKSFMQRHRIPTAAFHVVTTLPEAEAVLTGALRDTPVVVKADGLCAGKGVTLCDSADQARAAVAQHLPQGGVVIEERLSGREASCMALVDGEAVLPLPPCEDHKSLGDGDTGPMTGGMGAICPTPVVSDMEDICARILRPAARGLVAEGRPFSGLLFAGLMFTATGPRVLEFNCRFGDPETQALLPLLDEDLGPLLRLVAEHRLSERTAPLRLRPAASVCVVLTAAGYPGAPRHGDVIRGVDPPSFPGPDVQVFHAGTARDPAGVLRTAGGRVLGVTAQGADLTAARARSYQAASTIAFPGATLRRDIGAR